MPDVMQFRIARSPQRRIPEDASLVPVSQSPLVDRWLAAEAFPALATDFLAGLGVTDATRRIDPGEGFAFSATVGQLREFDRQLAAGGNRLTPKDVDDAIRATLGGTPGAVVKGGAWIGVRTLIAEALVAAVVAPVTPDLRSDLTRLMLVLGLVESRAHAPASLKTAEDIYGALRWRLVSLPEGLLEWLRVHRPARLARKPGFADLFVLREEWNRYEAGEIAYIENVLPGETRGRELTRVDETDQTVTVDQTRTVTNERDSQTTDRFDLHDASTSDVTIAAHIDGKVDTSGQYGPTHVDTHLGGSLDYSQQQSDQHATDQSRETVARAVTSVQEQTHEIRTTHTLNRVKATDTHNFVNATKEPAVGIYRWVDKIQRIQQFRYRHRYLLEFEVPRPAAWWIWLQKNKNAPGVVTPLPIPFTTDGTPDGAQLTASDILPDTYQAIGARYAANGLTPPPDDQVVATSIKRDSIEDAESSDKKDKQPIRFGSDATMAVPDGYEAATWQAAIHSWHNGAFGNAGATVRISVGAGDAGQAVGSDVQGGSFDKILNGVVGDISVGNIPVAIMSDAVTGYAIDIDVTCTPLAAKVASWRIANYEVIASAYFAIKRQRDQELTAAGITGDTVAGSSPERNQEVVTTELKRLVVEMLTGDRFSGRPALVGAQDDADPPVGPHTDLNAAAAAASEIQFLEQAFEWENLVYILYPYYWAAEGDWSSIADIEGTDPDFDRFLRAGSARVVVPARRTFETQVQMYAAFGALWGGGPVPAPADEGYLSVADELRSQQQPPPDGDAGASWEVRLPTTLIWLENAAGLPANPAAVLDAPPGKVLPA